MKRLNPLFLILFLLTLFSVTRCAKRTPITGGLKDTLPPVLVKAFPKQNSLNYKGEEIRLYFNEYILLKDIKTQLIVSPPIENNTYEISPISKPTKKIHIKILDSLLANTTYSFNFGAAIEDFNEGNKLPFFNYTFSTGNVIDSLTVRGKVENVIEKESPTEISIQLYPIDSTYNDSTIFNTKPFYVGNTLDSTLIHLQNIKPGKYELIALKDFNKDYYFDPDLDHIAFLEKPIELPKDSVQILRLFKEKGRFRWATSQFITPRLIEFGYYGDYNGDSIVLKTDVPEGFEYLINKKQDVDTLNFWFKNGEGLDSLVFEFKEKDSLIYRTIKFLEKENDSLTVTTFPKGVLPITDTVQLISNLPLKNIDVNKMKLMNSDSTEIELHPYLTENYDKVFIDFDILPNDKYFLELQPQALIDFWGSTNETLTFSYSTLAIDTYGSLTLTINDHEENSLYFIELLDSKDEVVRKILGNESNVYTIDYLEPGEYKVRIIRDRNQNKHWDTGNYLLKIQPEEVIYFNDPIKIRENWSVNEVIKIEAVKL